MTRILAALALSSTVVFAGGQATFRSSTEMVRIDTLVEHSGTPVLGLTAEDFTVLDNGMPQRIVTLNQMGAVAVGVALDASGSMKGVRFDLARDATLALLAQLKADESSVVIGFADQTARIIPAGLPESDRQQRLDSVLAAGSTALADGAYAAVIACDTGPGSKLLVVLTDGRSNGGWLDARDVIDAARRHEVVIYPIAIGGSERPSAFRGRGQGQGSFVSEEGGSFSQSSRQSRPNAAGQAEGMDSDALKLLEVIAEQTGGRAITARWTDDLSAKFRAILDEYRQRYIIAFAPEGVSKGDGWHTLQVKLRKGAKGDVHARAGYWSPATAGAPAASK
jgi:Ca-activated chloride channel homolog